VTPPTRHDLDGTFEVQVGQKVVTQAALGVADLLAEPFLPRDQAERLKRKGHPASVHESRPLVAFSRSANQHVS
jgi:hypothetical protein